jgi:hypothetical protein
MATQPRKAVGKKPTETPRKGRPRQPSSSEEEGAAATSLPGEIPDESLSLRTQLSQLTQAVATLQAQVQQSTHLTQSPSRLQRQRMATPDSASRRRLLSPSSNGTYYETISRLALSSICKTTPRSKN